MGSFKIIKKVSSHAYELDVPISLKIHPVIHIRYLKQPKEALRFPNIIVDYRKPPVFIDNNQEYEVEAILKKRLRKYGRGSRMEYLIHWMGYPSEEDSWEPRSNLTNCGDLLKEFLSNEHNIITIDLYVIYVIYKGENILYRSTINPEKIIWFRYNLYK